VRTTLVEVDQSIRNDTPTCTNVEKGLTFGEKVGVNDELVEVDAVEERGGPGGRRERRCEESQSV